MIENYVWSGFFVIHFSCTNHATFYFQLIMPCIFVRPCHFITLPAFQLALARQKVSFFLFQRFLVSNLLLSQSICWLLPETVTRGNIHSHNLQGRCHAIRWFNFISRTFIEGVGVDYYVQRCSQCILQP